MFKKFVQQDQDRLQLTEVDSARRDFLVRSACMAGGAALGGAYLPQAMAAGPLTLKATHGTGLCNCPFFLVKERNLAQGVSLDFVTTPSNADIAALFGAGVVDVSVVPYTNFMTLYDAGAPIKIVAGSGVQGCVIVAQPGITSAAQLRGKTIGTFQADTLEMLPLDYLKKAGMSFADVKVRYFGTSPELAQAFIGGNVDAMCHIEPYATQALKARPGAVQLSNGVDVYGANYTDCVLAVRSAAGFLASGSRRAEELCGFDRCSGDSRARRDALAAGIPNATRHDEDKARGCSRGMGAGCRGGFGGCGELEQLAEEPARRSSKTSCRPGAKR